MWKTTVLQMMKMTDGVPWVVSKTFSALLGNPSQDGVWVSGSISTQCINSSRL